MIYHDEQTMNYCDETGYELNYHDEQTMMNRP